MVFCPGCQFAGQTSPCFSTNWNAFTSLKNSSGFLPTGRSLTEACLTIPLSSMIQVALNEIPVSSPYSMRQPQSFEMVLLMSDRSGIYMSPKPPSFLDLRQYSMWEKCESTEQATTSHPISLNYLALLLKAMIQVGQTKVKSRGQKKRTRYFPLQSSSLICLKSPLYQELPANFGAGFLTNDISFYYEDLIFANL